MEQEHQVSEEWESYVDWRNRPALKARHGGMLAASFVLVVEVMENLAFLANASNLVMYLSKEMHFSPSKAANNVTGFMGTAFLLALLGGFLSDVFFTTFHVYLLSSLVEFLGLVILTVQGMVPSLKPPPCDQSNSKHSCTQVDRKNAAVMYTGLYLVALGVGGIKGSLPSHGAEQFDHTTPKGRKMRSTFFNYFVFCLSCGGLIAVTLVVWIEDNMGWQWGFGISTLTILLSIPVFLAGSALYRNKMPIGSPLTTILKVLVAAIFNNCISTSSRNVIASVAINPSHLTPNIKEIEECPKLSTKSPQTPTESLKFLNRAILNNPIYPSLQCTLQQLEEVKIVLKTIPIFTSTIILNSCLAQLSTFSIEQASTMNTKIASFKVPPASLPIFPILFIIFLAPIYNHFIIPFARKVNKSETGITHLQRIGFGLILSVLAMAVAALVETKRKRVAIENGLIDSGKPLSITFLWIAFQYLFLGSADLFTLAGLLEFFFTEVPATMRSLGTSLSWASLAIGYYLSSVIVSLVNNVTENLRDRPWLAGSNINHYYLEGFYWLLCVLSGLNFLQYLFWATRYKYRLITANG